ncbi:uncharacterized protein TNCV_4574081 [Trichonephila clavipes]|nr:uncharacterized protein TNCV_4574081 [Trichonephila clavipes]
MPVMLPTHLNCYENARCMTFLHFTSENFRHDTLIGGPRFTCKVFYKNNDCAPIALQKFWTLKAMKKCFGSMNAQGLEKIIRKFEDTGAFYVQSGRGRKRVNSTGVEEVATTMQEESNRGLQSCSA